MNIPDIRLLNQHLVCPQLSDVVDVVASMGAMQAQEYKMMRWAVGMRLKNPSMKAFREAYDAGRIIRTHLFRCTWQLVAAEDVGWMMRLCADKNRSTINGYTAYTAYFKQKITEKEYEHANELIREALVGQGSMRRDALLARLAEQGLTGDPHTTSVYLRRAEFDGIICSGCLDERQSTYALTSERLPQTPELAHDEAVALLARRYFGSHSPATLEDFVWWSNLGVGDCRNAIGAIGSELTEERFDGTTYYIHRDCRTKGCRKQTILLPSYDEYLIGYKSRHHVIEEEYRSRAYSNNGLFNSVVVHNGRIVGNWYPTKKSVAFFKEEYTVDTDRQMKCYLDFLGK